MTDHCETITDDQTAPMPAGSRDEAPPFRALVAAAMRTYHVQQREIIGTTRDRRPALARWAVCYLANTRCGMGFVAISRQIGRDPRSVRAAVEETHIRIGECPRTRQMIETIWQRAARYSRTAGRVPLAIERVSVRAIIAAASAAHDLAPAALTGRSRMAEIVRARQQVCWLAHRRGANSLQLVGAALGGRDHTTVLHAVRQVDAEIVAKPEIVGELATIWRHALALHRSPKTIRLVPAAPPPAQPAAEAPHLTADGQTQAGGYRDSQEPEKEAARPPLRHWSKYRQHSPEWFRANDIAFKRGLARAYGLEAAE